MAVVIGFLLFVAGLKLGYWTKDRALSRTLRGMVAKEEAAARARRLIETDRPLALVVTIYPRTTVKA